MIIFIAPITIFLVILLMKNMTRLRKTAQQHALNAQFVARNWWRLCAICALPAYLIGSLWLGSGFIAALVTALATGATVMTIRAFSYWPRRSPVQRDRQWLTPRGKEFDPYA